MTSKEELQKKIIVVEDEKSIALGLKALLELENYHVILCGNGKEAVAKAVSTDPDFILLDVSLPQMNGFEVCREIRAKGYVNPIIMLTARAEQIDKVIGLEAGADDYITKPFDGRELLARIRAHHRRMNRMQHEDESSVTGLDSTPRRRLLSIMFTDMADYSKKMHEQEALALKVLERHNAIMQHMISSHEGRVVEITGDAFLASFESAVQAVECAIGIQKKFLSYNRRKTSFDQIHVRIGVHLGDVIEAEGKLKGDAVNIAARIQQLAKPGDIFLSESVAAAIHNKIALNVVSADLHRLKNIQQAIRVFHITVESSTSNR